MCTCGAFAGMQFRLQPIKMSSDKKQRDVKIDEPQACASTTYENKRVFSVTKYGKGRTQGKCLKSIILVEQRCVFI